MPFANISTATLIVSALSPAKPPDDESSMGRARQAQARSWSLRHLLARRGAAERRRDLVERETESLQMSLKRLAETSPHLLIDIGVDPDTGRMLADSLPPLLPHMPDQKQVLDPRPAAAAVGAHDPRKDRLYAILHRAMTHPLHV